MVALTAKCDARARITNQFRKQRQTMAYDLKCDDIKLTIEISTDEVGASRGQWSVQAYAHQAPDQPPKQRTVEKVGVTRGDALTAVARAWRAKRGTDGFPALDWDAVAQALQAVRAI